MAGFLLLTDMLANNLVAFLSCKACDSSLDALTGILLGEDGVDEDDEVSILIAFFLSVKLRHLGMV